MLSTQEIEKVASDFQRCEFYLFIHRDTKDCLEKHFLEFERVNNF